MPRTGTVFLSELPRLIESRRVPIDVVLLQVSPPDARGMVSLGVSVDIIRAAVNSARLVIAERIALPCERYHAQPQVSNQFFRSGSRRVGRIPNVGMHFNDDA